MSRELDAQVAEKVMGLKVIGWATCVNADGAPSVMLDSPVENWLCAAWHGAVYQRMADLPAVDPDDKLLNGVPDWALEPVPDYTTDPSADYAVLAKVRETFDKPALGRFLASLMQIWAERFAQRTGGAVACPGGSTRLLTLYEPGDWSLGALSSLPPAPAAKAEKPDEPTH